MLSNPSDLSGTDHAICSLPVLVLNVHSRCNCRCVMCDIWKRTDQTALTPDDLERMLDSIRKLRVQWVVFTGGEPLMNQQLPVLARMLRQEGIRLTLLSTGILLGKYAAEVASTFDEVIISLDGPPSIHDQVRRVRGAFEALSSGVHELRAIDPDLTVRARTTVQKANHHSLHDTVDTARDLGLNSISFLAADITSTAFDHPLVWPSGSQSEISVTPEEVLRLELEIERIIEDHADDIACGFIVEDPDKLRRIAQHFQALLGQAEFQAPVCNAPWVSTVIEVDGTVKPCFFHRAIGNIHDASLETIVNGTVAREFRENLDVASNKICKSCVCSLNYRAS